MRVVFRADASVDMGMGHVMRCLTLAGELALSGAQCLFLCRELPEQMADSVQGHGHGLYRLPAASAGLDWQQDAEDCRQALSQAGGNADWMIVDHYGLDCRWQGAMRVAAHRLMVIDDMADRPHDCDLLLDQNIYPGEADRYATLVPASAKQLLGPSYALLRREFGRGHDTIAPRSGVVRTVLVSFGGTDPANATALALEALVSLGRPDMLVHVVLGTAAPHGEAIARAYGHLPWVRLHRPAHDMAELMAHSDLALGAGGSTVWERCALALPALLISLAANQEPIARGVDRAGAARYLGPFESMTVQTVGSALQSMLQAPTALAEMSQAAWRLVDGRGTRRVVEEMRRLS